MFARERPSALRNTQFVLFELFLLRCLAWRWSKSLLRREDIFLICCVGLFLIFGRDTWFRKLSAHICNFAVTGRS